MGMFDNVRCEYPLPEGAPTDGYQTKDTPEPLYLNHYVITVDGRLTSEDGEPTEHFDGDLNFYHSNVSGSGPAGYMTDDGQPYTWWDFTAHFRDGKLIDIRGGKKATPPYFAGPPCTREEFWRELKKPSEQEKA